MKRVMNKNFLIVLGLVLLLSISFVAAQEGAGGGKSPLSDLSGLLENGFKLIQPVLEVLFGEQMNIDYDSPVGERGQVSSDYIARIMFFFVIFSLVYMTVLKIEFFNQNDFVRWIITIAVSVLSTRWLASEEYGNTLVQTLLLPYDTLGLSFAAFLPLVIYFIFLDVGFSGKSNTIIRKSGWIFFFVIFCFLWVSRAGELAGAAANYAGWVYPISAALCLIFFFTDRTIQTYFNKMKGDAAKAKAGANLKLHWDEQVGRLREWEKRHNGDLKSFHSGRTGHKGKKAFEDDMDFYHQKLSE